MKKLILFLITIGCLTTTFMHATESNVDIDGLLERCAERVIEDRVYIKPGAAFVSQKDIFLKIDGDVIPLEAIYCDREGVFIYAYQLGSLIRCGTCKRLYDPEKQRPICPHRFRWE